MAARLDAAMDLALDEQRIVGAVVLVAHRGRIVYHRAAGYADREAATDGAGDALSSCFVPGAAWRYSLAYDVLGGVLERAVRHDEVLCI
jgi:hypothetical protein